MRLTLNAVLWVAVFGLTALLGGLYLQVSRSSAASVEAGARSLREKASQRVTADVAQYLQQGTGVLDQLEKQLKAGQCLGAETESCLLSTLIANPNLAEVTLTSGVELEPGESGELILADEGRRQVMLFRSDKQEACTREVTAVDGGYQARIRCRDPARVLGEPGPTKTLNAEDPTDHLSFIVPAAKARRGRTLHTDLSYSQLDDQLPEAERRVVVTPLRAVESAEGKLLGVIKVGLLEKQIRDLVARSKVNDGDEFDPYRIFLADEDGRLITGLCASDVLKENEDEQLRIDPQGLTDEVKLALANPALASVDAENVTSTGDFLFEQRRFLATYRLLPESQGWRMVVVGPEDYYLRELERARRTMLFGSIAVLGTLFVGGVFALRTIRKAFKQIEAETQRMSRFDFAPTLVSSRFADVRDTLFGLELAKTAVRAMGRYVPLTLVRRLFEDNKEPILGGTLREVTIFFSDIEGFTQRAEEEPPDIVAQWLGRYLEAMTSAVHAEQGTVDKFIGDSVMALWNAPTLHPDHAVLACRAALRCQLETAKLYATTEWKGRPALVTRIGLHLGSVMVGHFGAPERLSYTAIGDGVNLASRLEGLNKHYGTRLLASEEVYQRAKDKFVFRQLDTVAVKGKSKAIAVYELLGESGTPVAEAVKRYEAALALYRSGDFAGARALLVQSPEDPPSRVLADRCTELEKNPPPQPWKGVLIAREK